MCKRLFLSLALALVITGCSERYGGHMYPIPTIPVEHAEIPDESRILTDLKEQYGNIVSTEIISEIHSVKSHTYLVAMENGTETPEWFKMTYLLIEKVWVCVVDPVKM